MGFTTKASDWEAVGFEQIGGAIGAGGGVWAFRLQSWDADYAADFVFVGAGVGGGGHITGTSLPDFGALYAKRKGPAPGLRVWPWAKLTCDNEFSAADLDWAPGRITTGGIGLLVGYSLVYISAKKLPFKSLFLSQSCSGLGTGLGAAAMAVVGLWKWARDADTEF